MSRRPARKAASTSDGATAEKSARRLAPRDRAAVPDQRPERRTGPLDGPSLDALAGPLEDTLAGTLPDALTGPLDDALDGSDLGPTVDGAPGARTAGRPATAVVGTRGPIGPLRGMVGRSGRLTLGVPRVRGVPSIDVVEFTAACPSCGQDVLWIEEREETKLRIIIECPCAR